MMSQQQPAQLSLLEQLPSSVFFEIARYLLVVEYGDPNVTTRVQPLWKRLRPFICRVSLKRGHALAVCSKRCNQLFEEAAKAFLCRAYVRPDYFVPNVPTLEKPHSHLVQFYRIKSLEVKFRNESKLLKDMLTVKPARNGPFRKTQPTEYEERLLIQVKSVLDGALVKSYATEALADCTSACSRLLHCHDRLPKRRITYRLPKYATELVPILEKIILLTKLEDPRRLIFNHYARPDVLSMLYFANLKGINPNLEKAEAALAHLLEELNLTAIYKSRNCQEAQTNAYVELFSLYSSQKRFDDAYDLLCRGREQMKNLDPMAIHMFTRLVKTNHRVLGRERATAYVIESVDILYSIQFPAQELLWMDKQFLPARWHTYKQDCSSWLRELQNNG